MTTVTSQLSFPQLLVPVSATRARIDLEVLYWYQTNGKMGNDKDIVARKIMDSQKDG